MFACQPVSQRVQDLDLGRVLTPDFEEDEELAAARDLITADLKVVLETDCAHGAVAMCKSTPPPPSLGMLQQHTSAVAMGHMQHHHQEASGAAGSSCGASSPQASCDTAAARAQQQFWTSAQQYDAAYGLVLAHSPPASHYAAAPPHMGGGAAGPYSAGGMACAGPCCNPSANLLPQGSSSLAGLPDFSSSMLYGGAYGPAGMSAGMVPHAAFGGNSSSVVISRSTPVAAPMHSGPGGVPAPPPAAMRGPQRVAASNYPPVQGGVLKKSASGVRLAIKAEPDSRPSQRRSADGSCSSQDGTPVPPSKARKGAASKAGTAGAASGGRSRASATSGAAVAGNASSSSLIKELQQEVCSLRGVGCRQCYPVVCLQACRCQPCYAVQFATCAVLLLLRATSSCCHCVHARRLLSVDCTAQASSLQAWHIN